MKRQAFSLIEMLVVISIIAILLAAVFPIIGALQRDSWRSSGTNTLSVAVASARAYSGAARANIGPQAEHSGMGIVFSPTGELRLVENDQRAMSDGSSAPANALLEEIPQRLNGYKDIPGREYIDVPNNVGYMGVTRNSAASLTLLPPPFAVRFDKQGNLVAHEGTMDSDAVYYDADCDGRYSLPGGRPAGYDLGAWDLERGATVTFDATEKRYHLPFECMESVVAVLIYSKSEFRATFPGSIPATIDSTSAMGQWLLDPDPNDNTKLKNAQMILLNRYTGAVMREGLR